MNLGGRKVISQIELAGSHPGVFLKLEIAALISLSVVLTGCTAEQEFATDGSCDGIEVVVNYSGQAENSRQCIGIDGSSELAKNVLASAGIAVEGTKAYGDAVVCRVDGVPSSTEPIVVEGEEPYIETCEDMPAAFAYWGLWMKQSTEADWEYAMEGIGSLQLVPGQSLGLAFSLAGAAPTPEG